MVLVALKEGYFLREAGLNSERVLLCSGKLRMSLIGGLRKAVAAATN